MIQDLIRDVASRFNIDPDFLSAVAYQESRFDPGAVSHRGATGLMQIMPDTAADPGFGVQPMADPANDVLDPEKNVTFGAEYLRKMMDRYNGNAKAALVAYNWGPGNADKWVASGGNVEDLPAETQQYISRIADLYEEAKAGNPPSRTATDVAKSTAYSARDRLQEMQKELQNPSRIRTALSERADGPPPPSGVERVKDEIEWATKAIGAGLLDTAGILAMLVDGPLELTTPLVEKLDEVSADIRDSIPEWMKPSLHKKIFKETKDGGIEFDWPSLRQVANLTLESLSPGGAIVGGGKLALRGLSKIRKLEKLVEKYPRLAAATSLGAANSTYIAADTYREVYNRVLEQAQAEGMSLKEAHDEASRSASFGSAIAGAIAFPTGMLGEGLAATGKSLWTRLGKGVVFGATTEAPEESGQYLAEQIGSNEPIKLAEFLERGVLGAFGAGPVEGVMAALTGSNPDAANAPVPPNEAIAEGLADGEGAVARSAETLVRNLIENPPAPPAEPEQQTLDLPEPKQPTAKEKRVARTAQTQPVATLPDGSTQHREKLKGTQKDGTPYAETIINPDGTQDQLITYYVDEKTKTMQISVVHPLPENQQGKGKGIAVYENMVGQWLEQGYTVKSDNNLTPDAVNMYHAMSRRGYNVQQNPDAKVKSNGGMTNDMGGEVFTVTAPPAVPKAEQGQVYNPAQGNLSLPPGTEPGGQMTLGSSDLNTLAQKPAAPQKARNRGGRYMATPGPVEPEVQPEANPAQQELDLPQRHGPEERPPEGMEALREPPQPASAIQAQFEKLQKRFKKLKDTRLMDPDMRRYPTRAAAAKATKPVGSQIVRIGERFYIAAPAGPSTVYETEDTWVPNKRQEKQLEAATQIERKIDRHFYERDEMVEDYRALEDAYIEAKRAGDENMMQELDKIGSQLAARWRQEYNDNIKDVAREVKAEPLTTEVAPAPEPAPEQVVQRDAGIPTPSTPQAATAPAPASVLSNPPAHAQVTPESPSNVPLQIGTRAQETPPSDKVAAQPHVPPEQRAENVVNEQEAQTELPQEVTDALFTEEELKAFDPDDSIAAQRNQTEQTRTRKEATRAKKELEDLSLELVKQTNVTWHVLWTRLTNPRKRGHRMAAVKKQYRHLDKLSTTDLLKRVAKSYGMILRMYVQDSFLPVRYVQQVIEQLHGTLPESMNFYRSHELMHSKIDREWQQLQRQVFDPLAKRMRELGVTQDELDNYLWYTHAPYRNAHISRMRAELNVTDVNEGNPNGSGISNEAAAQKRRELVAGREEAFRELDRSIREISGTLRGLYRNYGLVPDTLLAKWDGDASFALTYDNNLQPQRPANMSQEKWNEQMFYATYVPLMSVDSKPYEALLSNLFGEVEANPAVDVFGDEVRSAMGRIEPPAAQTAHLQMMLHMAVVRGERNNTLGALYELAKENPNDYLWEVEEIDMGELADTVRDPITGLETWQDPMPSTHQQAAVMRANMGMPGIVAGNRMTADEANMKGTFRMKKDGKVITVHTYWGPMTRAIRNAERLPKSMAGLKAASKFSRWIAIANTTLSPGFAVANLVRDFMTAKINLTEENGLNKLNEHVTLGNWKHAMKAYWNELSNNPMPDQMTDPEGYKWRQLVNRYMAAGAHTAFFEMRTALSHYTELERLSSDNALKADAKSIAKMLKGVYNVMNQGNTAIENAVRLITFAAGVDPQIGGMTDAQAASVAKNLTVNFQKRGHASVWLGALYVFFNATMQGNMRIIGALRRSKNVKKIVGGIAVGGFANAVMNEILGGDDDDGQSWYSKVPEHVRERNIVFMIPGGQGRYVSIPLPYGFNAFWVAGDSLGSAVFHDPTAPGPEQHELLMRPLSAFYNTFNPVASSSFIRSLTPTFAEPVHDIITNRNFFGSQINPEKSPFDDTPPPDAYNVLDPDQQRQFQWVAQTLGKLTGGSPVKPGAIDIAPGTLRYLWEYLGGSGLAGATLTRTMDAIPMLFSGEFEAATRKTPVIRRLYGMTPEFNHKERFYQLRTYLKNMDEERTYLRSLRFEDPTLYDDFMEEHEVFYSTNIVNRMKSVDRQVGSLTKKRNKIRALADKTEGQKNRIDMYNQRIDRLITNFNTMYFNLINRNQL